MRINREAKGSAYLRRSQLLLRKSLQNINYHYRSAAFTSLKQQRQNFVSQIVHPMGPVKPRCGICGILLQLVDKSSEVHLLGNPRPKSSNAQDRCGSGPAARGQLCSQSNCRLREGLCLRQQEQVILIKPLGEFLVRSQLLRSIFNSGCRRRIFRLCSRLTQRSTWSGSTLGAYCLQLDIKNIFRPFCI